MAFKVNSDMKKYITLQRTGLKSNHEVKYYNSCENDFNDIKSFLKDIKSSLDIGCGLGGINYFIGKEFPSATINLLDKTKIDDSVYYGYANKGSFYNNLKLAKEFLQQNGIKNEINIIDVDKIYFPKVDLIISLISWGFHYPINTYLKEAIGALNENGIIIIDVRTTVFEEVKKEFLKCDFNVDIIKEYKSYCRILAKKC